MSNRNQFERIAWDECVVGQDVWTWHYTKREIVPFGKVTNIEDTPKKFSIEITEANGKVCKMMYTKEYGREETTLYVPVIEKGIWKGKNHLVWGNVRKGEEND